MHEVLFDAREDLYGGIPGFRAGCLKHTSHYDLVCSGMQIRSSAVFTGDPSVKNPDSTSAALAMEKQCRNRKLFLCVFFSDPACFLCISNEENDWHLHGHYELSRLPSVDF